MGQESFIPVATNARSRSDLVERGFSRQPLRVDVDIARSLEALSHAAWSIPKDKYYDGGDRYRSLNRVRAEIVEGGVKVWLSEESTPYVQLKKYNTTIGGQPREYAPLPSAIAGSIGVRKMIAHHLYYLPLSTVGTKYLVNVHLIRFTAAPGRPCDTSPPGLHKDGEKYIATHLVGRCGAQGGEVIITDNDRQEMDRFTMRESGECYVFDDDRIWHMLTPVAVLEGNQYATVTRWHSICCQRAGNPGSDRRRRASNSGTGVSPYSGLANSACSLPASDHSQVSRHYRPISAHSRGFRFRVVR